MGPNQFWMDSRVETDVYFIVRQGYIRICVGYPSPYEFIRPSSIYLLGGGAFGRAPKGSIYLLASQISQKKGDGGLNSRAFVPHPAGGMMAARWSSVLRIQFTYWVGGSRWRP